MPIASILENNHALFFGNSVPVTAVNLGYYEAAIATPEACVTIMHTWNDIPGNQDEPLLGTRQIRVQELVQHPSGCWTVGVTPGSFYTTETPGFADGRLVYTTGSTTTVQLSATAGFPSWVTTTPYTFPIAEGTSTNNEVQLRWEYSLGLQQSVADSLNSNYADPCIIVGDDAIPSQYSLVAENPVMLGGALCQLAFPIDTTADITTWPRVIYYQNNVNTRPDATFTTDTAVSFRCTVIDAFRGIVQLPRALGVDEVIRIQYRGVRDYLPFTTFIDADATGDYPLNLNPMVNQYHRPAPAENSIKATQTTILSHCMRLYLEPVRCVMSRMDGTAIATFTNPNTYRLSWCRDIDETAWLNGNQYINCLAHFYVHPPTVLGSLHHYDTRVRGGGIRETIPIINYPTFASFFDLPGVHLDGDVSMENGVVVAKVSRALYQQYGEPKIRDAISSSLAAGIALLIEQTD